MTSSIVEWLPVFRFGTCAETLLGSLNFLADRGDLRLHAYVIMEDHFHVVGSGDVLSNTMRRLLSYTARQIVNDLKTRKAQFYLEKFRANCREQKKSHRHRVWQPGYHPQVLYSDAVLIQKIEYVHDNPVRKGLVGKLQTGPTQVYPRFVGTRNSRGFPQFCYNNKEVGLCPASFVFG